MGTVAQSHDWPRLAYDEYKETRDTLLLYTQVVGKIRMALTPPMPNWGHAALKVTQRGLATGPLWVGDGSLGIEMDLTGHEVRLERSDGRRASVPLEPCTVAEFYERMLGAIAFLDVSVTINPVPSEIPDKTPLDQDTVHSHYSPLQAHRLFQAVSRVEAVFEQFQSDYWGKQAINFWWGFFDLSTTRFSGRLTRPPEGVGSIMSGSLTAESIAFNFALGDPTMPQATFIGHAYPHPAGIASAPLLPGTARWVERPGMFVLPYDDVRDSAAPAHTLLEFMRSAYDAVARLGGWDRERLEGIRIEERRAA